MNVLERNTMIADCVKEFQEVHDMYFPRGKPLEDEQWQSCIDKMDAIAAKYKKEIPNISGALCMAYLNDIEEYHKKWKKWLDENTGS